MNNKPLSELEVSSDIVIAADGNQYLKGFLSDLLPNTEKRFASFSFPISAIDPLAYLEMCWKEKVFQYYWEKPSDEFAIAAGGEVTTVTASGSNRFNDVNKQVQFIRNKTAQYSEIAHPCSGFFLLGGFSFFDTVNDEQWNSFAPASFTLPEWIILKDGKLSLVTFTIDLDHFSSVKELYQHLKNKLSQVEQTIDQKTYHNKIQDSSSAVNTPLPTSQFNRKQWIESVSEAKKLIGKNEFEKIVLARKICISKNNEVAPTQVVNKLRKQYINCYNFLIHKPSGSTFLGSTPERLASARNKLLLTEALAGSIERGETATQDSILEQRLSVNTKDRDEHNFVIKDIEERLEPFVKELTRQKVPEVKKLSNVQHLYTPIRAQLHSDSNIFEVVGQLHPTPAVGGYPWQNAAPYIKELEHFDRGMYAGPVGWINGKGNLEFAVAIRSALFTKTQAHLFAGCGIVENSDPHAEWEETNLKLKPMLSALQYD